MLEDQNPDGIAQDPAENQQDQTPNGDRQQNPQEKPPKREMSPSDYIIQRKDAQVQKLTGEIKALRDKMREYEPDAYSAEEDEEFLNSKISEATEPIQQHLIEMNEERELQSFFSDYPDAKIRENEIRAWAKVHTNLPFDRIYYAIVGKELLEQGASNARQAIQRSSQSAFSGIQPRGVAKGVLDMTDEEFERESARLG